MLSRKLEYLMALAKEGHFARAAASCHVAQPTLSAAIQQLEAELGVPIVKRGQRFQGLTVEGRMVIEAAQRMANERDRLRQQLRDRHDLSSGTLRIGVLGSAVPLLKALTLPFCQRFPQVNLSVMLQSPFDVQQSFEASSLDVAITYIDKSLRRRCRTHVLYTEHYDLLIRKGTIFSSRKSVSWEELRRLSLCLLSPDSPIFGKSESAVLDELRTNAAHIVTNAIWMVMDHVRTGKWASVLPRPVRIMVSGDAELEAIPLPNIGKAASVGIAVSKRESVSPLADAFFELATSNEISSRLRAVLGINDSGPSADGRSDGKGTPDLIRRHARVSMVRRGTGRLPTDLAR
ncbi:MAG TPA: LysR family transcriptional regulator [Bryobacteraceae bacterium]|nr:LysR family transcriptional regulator [Bryobacteraceae bacterium]